MQPPDVYQALWRRKFMIVGLTAVLVAGAYLLTKRETPIYTATSLVRIQQQVRTAAEAYGALQTGGRLAQTYQTITRTSTIAQRIYAELDGKVPYAAIAGHLSGAQIQDLDLLNITATSPSPSYAQLIANAAPVALQEFVASTGTLHDQVITIQRAGLPSVPSSPNLKLNLLIALVLGLILNAGLALAIDALADRATSPEEIERLTGVPTLAIIPSFSGDTAAKAIDPSSFADREPAKGKAPRA